MTDWKALETEYVHGTMSMRELAESHGIKSAGLMRRAASEKWDEQRKQKSAAVSKVVSSVLTELRIDELTTFNLADLGYAKTLQEKAESMMKSVDSPQALLAIAKTFDAAQKIGRLALGVSTASNELTGKDGKSLLPSSDPKDLTDDQLAAIIARGGN